MPFQHHASLLMGLFSLTEAFEFSPSSRFLFYGNQRVSGLAVEHTETSVWDWSGQKMMFSMAGRAAIVPEVSWPFFTHSQWKSGSSDKNWVKENDLVDQVNFFFFLIPRHLVTQSIRVSIPTFSSLPCNFLLKFRKREVLSLPLLKYCFWLKEHIEL